MPIRNQSIGEVVTWTADGLTYTESIRQEYSNCVFSAGTVEGHPIDTMYFKLEGEDRDDILVLMRPDEISALAWCLNGALWSVLV